MIKTYLTGLAIFALLVGCASVREASPLGRIDHVVIGVPDLDAAVASIQSATGVLPLRGGVHPGRGTHNALLSLGDHAYLELIAAQPDSKTSKNLDLRSQTRPTVLDWAVTFDSPERGVSALQSSGFPITQFEPGSRTTPSGSTLHWDTFGLATEFKGAPFFIVWALDSAHPSSTSPAGCKLLQLNVNSPNDSKLRSLVKALQLDVTVQSAAEIQMSVLLRCNDKKVAIQYANYSFRGNRNRSDYGPLKSGVRQLR